VNLIKMAKDTLKFPKGFLWGASASAHQVEGDNINNWSEWEKKNAERLAREAKDKWQSWQVEKFPEMLKKENYISGKACDHYNRYEEDFDIAASLGHNAHRFSIEWSRIEPEEGKFNEEEIEHYRKVIQGLRKRNLEPFVTLWHWPVPLWFRDMGGWESKNAVEYFARYVKKVAKSLEEEVKFWITINEPLVFSSNSYLKGDWPPQKRSIFSYFKVNRRLVDAHKEAYGIIKKINPSAQVGIAKNNVYFEYYNRRIVNRLLKKIADWHWNFNFLNKIKNHQDFIGLNHYFHNRVNYGFNRNENKEVSDLNWELYPQGIFSTLLGLKKYGKPVYITESGLADKEDKKRSKYIREVLENLRKAIGEGVDVKGYFYWSLLDNFEWDKGFWPRFGLVEVDYKNHKRKIRGSVKEYKKIIERQGAGKSKL